MKGRGTRKTETGTVISDKMAKTVTVKVERLVRHPLYKKYVKRYTTHKAHDEENICTVGDRVLIVETRPLSKTKGWTVKKIIEKAPEV